MKFLIEIGHPAHVHFFRESITRLKKEGHSVLVVSRNKEVTNRLLESYGIDYSCLSSPANNFGGLLRELFGRWWNIYKIIKCEKVDLVVSISGISTAFPACIAGIRNLTFTDTEDAKLTNFIAFPFSSRIYTPSFFRKYLGKKQIYYEGLHELSYLQTFDFEEAKKIRQAHGLPPSFAFIRLVANDALHDLGLQSSEGNQLVRVVEKLEQQFGAVLISSQDKIPSELSSWELKTPPSIVHQVLAGASYFVGDSPTMSVEAAILGVESHLVTPRVSELGNMVELENRYQLLKNHQDWRDFESHFERNKPNASLAKDLAWKFRKNLPNMNTFITQVLQREAVFRAH